MLVTNALYPIAVLLLVVVINFNAEELNADTEVLKYIHYKNLVEMSNLELDQLLEGYSGLILTGGPQHIPNFDNYPELAKEIYLISSAIKKKLIILGICLGFQLLNHYFGNCVITLNNCVVGCNKLNVKTVNTFDDEIINGAAVTHAGSRRGAQ